MSICPLNLCHSSVPATFAQRGLTGARRRPRVPWGECIPFGRCRRPHSFPFKACCARRRFRARTFGPTDPTFRRAASEERTWVSFTIRDGKRAAECPVRATVAGAVATACCFAMPCWDGGKDRGLSGAGSIDRPVAAGLHARAATPSGQDCERQPVWVRSLAASSEEWVEGVVALGPEATHQALPDPDRISRLVSLPIIQEARLRQRRLHVPGRRRRPLRTSRIITGSECRMRSSRRRLCRSAAFFPVV